MSYTLYCCGCLIFADAKKRRFVQRLFFGLFYRKRKYAMTDTKADATTAAKIFAIGD